MTRLAGIAAAVAALFFLLPAQPVRAQGALATACAASPEGLTMRACVCLEDEFAKVLTPEEMQIQLLRYQNKEDEWQRRLDAMSPQQRNNFTARVAEVTADPACDDSD